MTKRVVAMSGSGGSLALCAVAFAMVIASPLAAANSPPDPLSRTLLFGRPSAMEVKLSPDGRSLALLRPVGEMLNLWIAPVGAPDQARQLTHETRRGFAKVRWSPDGRYVLLTRDVGGEEHWQVTAVNVATGHAVDLTNDPSLLTKIVKLSAKFPGEALLAFNERDERYHDLYRVDLETGARTKVFENHGRYTDFIADGDFKVRLALRVNQDGSTSYFSFDGAEPRLVTTMPLGDLRSSRTLELRGGKLLMLDSRGTDFADVVELDLATGKTAKLATASAADITDIMTDGSSGKLLAVREDPLVSRWTVLDRSVQGDVAAIDKRLGSGWDLEGEASNGRTWLIASGTGSTPDAYGLWDRDRKRYTPLYSIYADLDAAPLAPTFPVLIPTSDGLKLPSYLTLPRGKTPADFRSGKARIPLVLNIHGGPWLRDRDRFDTRNQWLASLGYAALSVNYRGSVGFGRKFVTAADGQWSTRMHQDLIDVIDWAIKQGVADRNKVALYGLSYGGYSALLSLSFTPDRFACAVDLAGPSDLPTLLTAMPEWWAYQKPQFVNRIGDPDDPAGAKHLYRRSPISRVDQVRAPLLIGQGVNDPRVPVYQSDLIARALAARNKPVTYVLYPDEGHVFDKARTDISFHAVAEKFLSQCLGGPARAFGTDLVGSRMMVKIGADRIGGLVEALDPPRDILAGK